MRSAGKVKKLAESGMQTKQITIEGKKPNHGRGKAFAAKKKKESWAYEAGKLSSKTTTPEGRGSPRGAVGQHREGGAERWQRPLGLLGQ